MFRGDEIFFLIIFLFFRSWSFEVEAKSGVEIRYSTRNGGIACKFGGKWKMEHLNIRFPLPTLLYAGHSVTLIIFFWHTFFVIYLHFTIFFLPGLVLYKANLSHNYTRNEIISFIHSLFIWHGLVASRSKYIYTIIIVHIKWFWFTRIQFKIYNN